MCGMEKGGCVLRLTVVNRTLLVEQTGRLPLPGDIRRILILRSKAVATFRLRDVTGFPSTCITPGSCHPILSELDIAAVYSCFLPLAGGGSVYPGTIRARSCVLPTGRLPRTVSYSAFWGFSGKVGNVF